MWSTETEIEELEQEAFKERLRVEAEERETKARLAAHKPNDLGNYKGKRSKYAVSQHTTSRRGISTDIGLASLGAILASMAPVNRQRRMGNQRRK